MTKPRQNWNIANYIERARGRGFYQVGVITVGNSTELLAALAAAKGGETIQLKPGTYSVTHTNKTYTKPVLITSADPGNFAVFTKLDFTSVNNWIVAGVKFAGGAGPTHLKATTCRDVKVLDNIFDGGATEYNTGTEASGIRAMQFTTTSYFEVARNVSTGAAVVLYADGTGGSNANIHHNDFSKYTRDGIDFFHTGPFDAIIIDSNAIYKPLGALWTINHGDMIQIGTTGSAYTNVVITKNICASLQETFSQLMLLGADGTIVGLTVTDNFLQGNTFHGIAIYACTDAVVARNIVAHDPNAKHLADSPSGDFKPYLEATAGSTQVNVSFTDNLSENQTGTLNSGTTWTNNPLLNSGTIYGDYARDRFLPGLNTMTTIAEIKAIKMDNVTGPLWMRDPAFNFPAPVVDPAPELVVDPNYTSAANFVTTSLAGVSVSGGKLNIAAPASGWSNTPVFNPAGPLPAGTYSVTTDVTVTNTVGGAGTSIATSATTNMLSATVNGTTRAVTGRYTENIVVPAGGGYIGNRNRGVSTNFSGSINFVSVKRVS